MAPDTRSSPHQHHRTQPTAPRLPHGGQVSDVRGGNPDEDGENQYEIESKTFFIPGASHGQKLSTAERHVTRSHRLSPQESNSAAVSPVEDATFRPASVAELMGDKVTAPPAVPAVDPLLEPSGELYSVSIAPPSRYPSKFHHMHSGAGDSAASWATPALQETSSVSPVQANLSVPTDTQPVEPAQNLSAASAAGVAARVTTHCFSPPLCTASSSSRYASISSPSAVYWPSTASTSSPAAPAPSASTTYFASVTTSPLARVTRARAEHESYFTGEKSRAAFSSAVGSLVQRHSSEAAASQQVFSVAFFKQMLERIAQSQSDNARVHALLELETHAHSLLQDTACLHAALTVLDAVLCNAVSSVCIPAFPSQTPEADPLLSLPQQRPERVVARGFLPACTLINRRSAAETHNLKSRQRDDCPSPTLLLNDAAAAVGPQVSSPETAAPGAATSRTDAAALPPFVSLRGSETASSPSFPSVSSTTCPPSAAVPDTASGSGRPSSTSTCLCREATACELSTLSRELSDSEGLILHRNDTAGENVEPNSAVVASLVGNRVSYASTSLDTSSTLKTELLREASPSSGLTVARSDSSVGFRTAAADAASRRTLQEITGQQSPGKGEQRPDEDQDVFVQSSPVYRHPYTRPGREKSADEEREKQKEAWHGREGMYLYAESTAPSGASDTHSSWNGEDASYSLQLAFPFSPLVRLVCMRVYTSLCVTLDLLFVAPQWVERFTAVLILLITHVETQNSALFRRYACGCLEELERNWPGMLLPLLGTGCGLPLLKNRVLTAPAEVATPAEEATGSSFCRPFLSSEKNTSASSAASASPSPSYESPSFDPFFICHHSLVASSPDSRGFSASSNEFPAYSRQPCAVPSPPPPPSVSTPAASSVSASASSSSSSSRSPFPLPSSPALAMPFSGSCISSSSSSPAASLSSCRSPSVTSFNTTSGLPSGSDAPPSHLSSAPPSVVSFDTSSGLPSGDAAVPSQLPSAPPALSLVVSLSYPPAVSAGLVLLQSEQQPLVADALVNLLLLTAWQGAHVLSAAARQAVDHSIQQPCLPSTLSHAPIPNNPQQEQTSPDDAERRRSIFDEGVQRSTTDSAVPVHRARTDVKANLLDVCVRAGAPAAAETRRVLESSSWTASADSLRPFDPLTTFPVSPLPLAAVYSCDEASNASLPVDFVHALQPLLSEILTRFWELGEWTQAHAVHTLATGFRLLGLRSACDSLLDRLLPLLYSERPPLVHALLRFAAAAAAAGVLDAAAAQLVRQKLQAVCVNRVLKEHFRLLAMRWLGALLNIRLFAFLFFERPPCFLCPSPCDSSIAQEHLLQLLLLFYRRRREFLSRLPLSAVCDSVVSERNQQPSETKQHQQLSRKQQQQQQKLEQRLQLQLLSACRDAGCLPTNVVEVCEALQGCWCGPQPIGVHAVLYRFLLRLLLFPCQGLRNQVHAFLCEKLRLSPEELTNSTLAVLHHLSDCEEPSAAPGGESPCAACREWKQPRGAEVIFTNVENTPGATPAPALAGGPAASSTVSAAFSSASTPPPAEHSATRGAVHRPDVASAAAASAIGVAAAAAPPVLVAAPAVAVSRAADALPPRHGLLFHPSRPAGVRFGLVDAGGASSPLPLRVQSVAAHSLLLSLGELVKKLEPPSRISAFFPLLLRLSEEPAVPPAVVLQTLQRLVDAVLSCSSALEAQQQWETGMQVLAVCRQLLTNYGQRALLQPMSELLLRLADATANLDVRDNALLLLSFLLHAGPAPLRALLRPASAHLPVALAQQHLTCVSPYTYQFVGGVPFLEFRKSRRERLQLCGLRDGQAAFFLFCAGSVQSPVERQEGKRQHCPTCQHVLQQQRTQTSEVVAARQRRRHSQRKSRRRKQQERGQQRRVHPRACGFVAQQQTQKWELSQASTDGSVVSSNDCCSRPKCHADERSFSDFLQQIYRLYFESDTQTVALLSDGAGCTSADTLASGAHEQKQLSLDALLSVPSRRRGSPTRRTTPQEAGHVDMWGPGCCCGISCTGGWRWGSLSDEAAVAQYRCFVASTPFFVRMPFCLRFKPNFHWQLLESPPFPLPLAAAAAAPTRAPADAGHAPAAAESAKPEGRFLRTLSAAGQQQEGSGGGRGGSDRNDGSERKVLTELYGIELTFSQPEDYALLRSVHLPLLQDRAALRRLFQKNRCGNTCSAGTRKEGDLHSDHTQHTQTQEPRDSEDSTGSFFPFMYKLVLNSLWQRLQMEQSDVLISPFLLDGCAVTEYGHQLLRRTSITSLDLFGAAVDYALDVVCAPSTFWPTLFRHFWRDPEMIRSLKIIDSDRACVRRMIDMTLKPFLVLDDTADDQDIFDFEQDHYFAEAEYYTHLQDGTYLQSSELNDGLHVRNGEHWLKGPEQRHLHERVERVDTLEDFRKEEYRGKRIMLLSSWSNDNLHKKISVHGPRVTMSSFTSKWKALHAEKFQEFNHQQNTPFTPEPSKCPVVVNSGADTIATEGELEEAFTFLNEYFLLDSYSKGECLYEVQETGSLSSTVEVVRAIIFLPPRHHVLLKFSVSQYSTAVRIVVDRYQLLVHLDKFFAASSNLMETNNFRRR